MRIYLQSNTVTIPDLAVVHINDIETAVGVPTSGFTWTMGDSLYRPDTNDVIIQARHTMANGNIVERGYIFNCHGSWGIDDAYNALLLLPQYADSVLQE